MEAAAGMFGTVAGDGVATAASGKWWQGALVAVAACGTRLVVVRLRMVMAVEVGHKDEATQRNTTDKMQTRQR